MRLTRLVLIAGLVLTSSLLLAAPASAHRISFARSVSGSLFPQSGPPFDYAAGTVGSPNARCRRHSLVTLWRVTGSGPTKVGANNTGGDSRWTINPPGNFPNGDYFLTVKRKVLFRSARHRHVCPFLKTNTITISNP
jgi:hypothetical protein